MKDTNHSLSLGLRNIFRTKLGIRPLPEFISAKEEIKNELLLLSDKGRQVLILFSFIICAGLGIDQKCRKEMRVAVSRLISRYIHVFFHNFNLFLFVSFYFCHSHD